MHTSVRCTEYAPFTWKPEEKRRRRSKKQTNAEKEVRTNVCSSCNIERGLCIGAKHKRSICRLLARYVVFHRYTHIAHTHIAVSFVVFFFYRGVEHYHQGMACRRVECVRCANVHVFVCQSIIFRFILLLF